MSDEFLSGFRERPDPVFAETLYQRISRNREARFRFGARLAWTSLIVALALISAFVVSPELRAGAVSVIRTLGGVEVEETDLVPEMTGPVIRREAEIVVLSEADLHLPFALRLPARAPEGFELLPEAVVIPAVDRRPITTVLVTWQRRQQEIVLTVEERPRVQPPMRLVAGSGSAEEIELDGLPAALVRGTWQADEGVYDPTAGITLVWVEDGLIYSLRTTAKRVTSDDLIEMAASLP